MSSAIPFSNSYVKLPARFYSQLSPTPVAAPGPIRVNRVLARELGLDPDWLASPEGTQVLAGNTVPEGAAPLAAVYAGHQFGSFNPQLGDGRAILLGELVDSSGRQVDLQLKGAGRTPWSRGGDGRSPLGPVLREYIVSEAMAALGVPTTRALAAVSTGEQVFRDRALPGAVLARMAGSHVRIGTFEYFAARKDTEALQTLVDFTLQRHYPERGDSDNAALALLEEAIARQASLIPQWQLLGFIHGVMNTDNTLLSGETIDYGPCAFMDAFDPETVFSSIDQGGRYAYCNQPAIAHWNLACLAQALVPVLHDEPEQAVALAQAAVDRFGELYLDSHSRGLRAKLGLDSEQATDNSLIEDLYTLMAAEASDFTLTFRHLADLADSAGAAGQDIAELQPLPASFEPWLARWQARLAAEPLDPAERQRRMYRANPVFIPRNHLVEEAIAAATDSDDFGPFHRLVERLAEPFTYTPTDQRYALPPEPGERVYQTFCGT
ncbi:protein adenylyltransferase SelO [Kineobactrum salinum]|uniref:Protein nucleotidyltransferase YdiU n=1 Tax=Kineobactrum salinum TaxID=2708301 RepID=A0A6C0TZY4_9GAMM|nr:YdiU family protein [Kineobactrum salinum]QIB65341.1 YdiU family protein [Kineobactrum salinum]